MVKEFEFYHGLVFARLIHHSGKSISIEAYPTPNNASYVINHKIGVYIKYSSKRMTPWGFSFKKEHQNEIEEMRAKLDTVFIVLVCNDDGMVCLSYKDFKAVLDDNHEASEWIRIDRKPREKYSVKGTDGRLKFKIGESDFPKKMFLETGVSFTEKILSWVK